MAKIVLTEEQIESVEKLSSILNQKQLADFLGFTDRALRKVMDRDEKVRSAYKRGRAKGIANVATNLLKQAQNGNTTAAMFYLKTQAGWRETTHLDHSSSDGSMSPTVIKLVAPDFEQIDDDSED